MQKVTEIEKNFFYEADGAIFRALPNDEERAIHHYECNLMLAESLYVSLSVLEVTSR